ncbi:MAG: histone H1 [Methylovirgula sp.]
MTKTPKRPRDPNQLAKLVVDIAAGEAQDSLKQATELNLMASLGRAGGLRGGPARAEKLSDEKRAEIAKKAAATRWGRYHDNQKKG